jgi:integrase/recombinase XerD
MRRPLAISDPAESWIHGVHDDPTIHEHLSPRTLQDYAGDVRLPAERVETGWNTHREGERTFRSGGHHREYMPHHQKMALLL